MDRVLQRLMVGGSNRSGFCCAPADSTRLSAECARRRPHLHKELEVSEVEPGPKKLQAFQRRQSLVVGFAEKERADCSAKCCAAYAVCGTERCPSISFPGAGLSGRVAPPSPRLVSDCGVDQAPFSPLVSPRSSPWPAWLGFSGWTPCSHADSPSVTFSTTRDPHKLAGLAGARSELSQLIGGTGHRHSQIQNW